MSDLISRQDAIKAITQLPVKVDNLGYTWMIAGDVLKQIDDIPSTEPERTAKVKEGWGLAICCACKKRVFPCDKYCSHCGVKLEWE